MSSRAGTGAVGVLAVAGLVTAGLVAAGPARADDAVGELRMWTERMTVPSVAAEVGVTGTLDSAAPLVVHLALDARGIPGPVGVRSWLAVDGRVDLAPLAVAAALSGGEGGVAFDPVAFDARLSVHRRVSESKPIVAASDARFGAVSLSRDRLLGVEWGGLAQLVDWTGGLYLPANHVRDLDARVLIGARGPGVRFRRYTPDEAAADFLGAAIGGISGEVVYGRKLTPGAVLTGHLGARADWSIGDAAGFTAMTDTEVWLGGVLDLGRHHELRLLAATRTTEIGDDRTRYLPTLTTAWRTTW